ncbi:MAG: YsnF/AvaK domain-containing protein [Massilia sp.]
MRRTDTESDSTYFGGTIMQHTLIAVFDNRGDAQAALDELLTSGFSRQEVRLSEGDPTGASSTTAASTDSSLTNTDDSFTGSIKNFFSNMFGTDSSEHALKYSTAVTHGHYVLTLTAANEPEVERAADIVERHGPVDIDEKAAAWGGASTDAMRMGAGTQQQSASMSQQSSSNLQGTQLSQGGVQGAAQQGSQQRATSTGDNAAIPVIQEELRVGKREVQRGGVRIFQRIVETPVNETVNLREEHVNVERRPVDQPISGADLAAFEEKSIELRETAEEAVVQKSARVVEEVVVGKQVSEHQEQISDTVRHTEVEIEQLSAGAGVGSDVSSGVGMDATGNVSDDSYYRSHWNSNFASQGGSYDEFAPAYSYGSSIAVTDPYRGRQWNDVESNIRTDWETRNPGSAWDKFKAAIRHGWERVTS